MRQLYRTETCIALFALTSLAAVFVAFTTNGFNGLFLSSLPSSPWKWKTWTDTIVTPSSKPNLKTAVYPDFTNPKIQRAVAKLIQDLNVETLRGRGKKRDGKMEKLEAGLAKARAMNRDAIVHGSQQSPLEDADYVPDGEIYRNAFVFHSVVKIVEHLFHPIFHDKAVLESVIGNYDHVISTKYPFWNRSLGAGLFMLSCHDWGPRAPWYVKQLYFTSIRVLCNANTSEFFNPKKDVSFPEINLRTGNTTGLTGGYPPTNRSILAFFAGGLHGHIRPSIFEHWKDKDDHIKVYEKLPEDLSYQEMMKQSRYCLCPSGHEVASPRIVEAIYAECVPILMSQNYIPPFSDILDWNSFSLQISVGDLKNLKEILMGVSEERYRRMQDGVKQLQQHFLINDPPKRYDVFHMIIHSIWLRRLNIRIHG